MGHPLEQFYPYAPVWLQNLGISLYGAAWRHERLGGDFNRYVAEFAERDHWSVDRMQSYLQDQLRAFLLHAVDHVPFYRRVWGELGITRGELAAMNVDDLPRLPMTPKTLLQAMPEKFVAENVCGRLA